MRKVLFVHDGPIYKSESNTYFGIDYNTNLKKRYLYLGDEVTFLTRVKNLVGEMKISPIEGNDFNVVSVPNFKSLTKYLTLKSQAKKIIESTVKEHDVLIIRLPSSIGFIAWKYAIEYKKPYIVELVACPWDGYMNHSWSGKVVAPLMYLKTKSIVKTSPYVMYVSSEFLQKRYPTQGNELSCSDVTLPKVDENLLSLRLKKIKDKRVGDPIIFGTVGAIDMKYKGQHYVLKAMKMLINEGYDIEYHLVGGGSSVYLKRLATQLGLEGNVKFVGPLPHDEVLEFMQEIDIYIQPSIVESHGRVIIEAFSTACPVIGSSTGGIPELVDNNYIFKRKNVESLVTTFKKMLESDLTIISKENFYKVNKFKQSYLNSVRNTYYDKFLHLEELYD